MGYQERSGDIGGQDYQIEGNQFFPEKARFHTFSAEQIETAERATAYAMNDHNIAHELHEAAQKGSDAVEQVVTQKELPRSGIVHDIRIAAHTPVSIAMHQVEITNDQLPYYHRGRH